MAAKIQLYSLATPNGQKVTSLTWSPEFRHVFYGFRTMSTSLNFCFPQISCALEELGLEYDAHTINIMKGDQFTPEFIAVNPNSKIPAIVDPNGPGKHVTSSYRTLWS